MSEMPSGWVQAPLGQVATSQLGRMLSARRETGDHAKPYLRNRDVQWGHINVIELPVMDFGPSDAARFLLRPGDVLVCEGGEVGRAAIWHGQLGECYYQKALHRVRTSAALLPEFLLYLLEHYARTRAFERYTSGSTIAHLPQEDLKNLPVPIPPAAEQERIAAAIDEQFSRLDAGVAALERTRQNLKRMRSAILQRAIKAPIGTPSVFARDLFSWASGKRAPSTGSTRGQFPVFGGNGITGHSNEILKTEETIVIGRVGALCGNVYLTGGPAWITDNAIYAQSHAESVLPSYAVLVFRSARLRDRAAGTGQPFVNQVILNEVTVPLPSKERQADIVAWHDVTEEAISRIEYQLQMLNQRHIRLRSSILATAFSGNLVAQDHKDEPASVLLERIATERAPSNGRSSVRSRKPRIPQEKVVA